MKCILVTGAAGFLGSHLMLHHLWKGDFVLGIDDYSSSFRGSDHVRYIHKIFNGKLVDQNINDQESLYKTINSFVVERKVSKFDLVYNFACPASPPIYQSMPIDTLLTCTLGVRNILNVAKQSKAIVVHASTSEVYGNPLSSPQRETDLGNVNSYGPRACYDEGKRAAEALCFDYLNTDNIDVRLVRIFNTYGPHMSLYDGRVITNFIQQGLAKEKITIYGDGSQTRSFCYVDDLIDGIVKLGELQINPRTPVNLGNPNEFTILQLAMQAIKKFKMNDDFIQRKSLPQDDPLQRCPDITLAKRLLGWEPKVELDEGLDKTIEYFKRDYERIV